MSRNKHSHFARILSPKGVYPSLSVEFEDAIYVKDDELTYSVCQLRKHTRGGDGDESYSEVEWLNPSEARLYASLMLAVDRDENYLGFYPYPTTESFNLSQNDFTASTLSKTVKPLLLKVIAAPDVLHPGYSAPAKNFYRACDDIPPPKSMGGPKYDFRESGVDYKLAKSLYDNIDIEDSLIIRGVTTLIKAEMLHFHYQFLEAAIYSLFISMEVSFRLVVRALKAKGISEPTSKDAMKYIHDAFYDIHRVERYFEDYYDGRVMTFHPESRFGIFPHAPLAADDYFHLYNDMLEVYAFLITGYVNPKHKEKLTHLTRDAT